MFAEKKQEKLITQGRDASSKSKSKLVVICWNTLLERYYNEQSYWETPYKRVLWKLIFLKNCSQEIQNATWLGNTYITNTKETSHSCQSKCHNFFLWLRITIAALVLQLIWYCSTTWVSNIGDSVLILIFWFRIIKCWRFLMLGTITNNFLKTQNG